MSNARNARRINLSFRLTSPEQKKAYEKLLRVKNKTEYITDLILNQEQGKSLAPDPAVSKAHISQLVQETVQKILSTTHDTVASTGNGRKPHDDEIVKTPQGHEESATSQKDGAHSKYEEHVSEGGDNPKPEGTAGELKVSDNFLNSMEGFISMGDDEEECSPED